MAAAHYSALYAASTGTKPTVRGVAHAIHLKMKKQQLSSKFLEQSAAAHSSSPSLCSALNRPEKKISDHNLLLYCGKKIISATSSKTS